MPEPEQPAPPVSVVLVLLGLVGLLVSIAMLADARWALLVASLLTIYGGYVAATHGR